MFNPLRTVARQMLASMFIIDGIDALQNAEARARTAEKIVDPLSEQVPALEALDAPEAVRLTGAVQVAGGALLALGKLPRLASAALAATLVPITVAAHRFWEEDDPEARAQQQAHFFKNVSMLGGLLLGVLDTEGRPGFAWRTKHAVEHAGTAAERTAREASLKAETTGEKAKRATVEAREAAKRAKQRVELETKHQADMASTRAELAKKKLTPDVADAKRLVSAVRN